MATEIGNKVDKEEGKGLSTNDFTNDYKDALDNLSNMTFDETDPTVPAWAKAETKPAYTAEEVGLGNVNNTADMDKPVSTATQEALADLKTELSESIVAESDEWKVVDEAGNIIFNVDASGAHTTALTLNGEDVVALINERVKKEDGKGLSSNDFTDEYKAAIDSLDELGGGDMFTSTYDADGDGVVDNAKTLDGHAASDFAEAEHTHDQYLTELPELTATDVGALPDTTTLGDLTGDADHRTVSDTEKAIWNNKSDFSGDYNDLTNAPDITEDDSGNLVISDTEGNIIFRSDANGFETTQLTVGAISLNGEDLAEKLTSYATENYVDTAVANLVDSAPETLNTLNELAVALQENQDLTTTLNQAIGEKATLEDLNNHKNDAVVHITAAEREAWNAKAEISDIQAYIDEAILGGAW